MTSRFMLIFAAISGFIFVAFGTVLFSGSLYCLALSHLRLWAFVTPVGGVSFLAGWALMLVGAIRLKRKGVSHE